MLQRQENEKTNKPQLLLACLLAIALAIGITAIEIMHGCLAETAQITVPEGAGTSAVAEILQENGAIRSSAIFKIYIKLSGGEDGWQPGTYTLEPGDGYKVIREMFTQMAYKPDVSVLIREGLQIPEIGKILEESGICSKADFISACENWDMSSHDFLEGTDKAGRRKLEGYLFPDTQVFPGYGS